MVITVTQETEKQLTALAERVGAPVAVYAGHLLEQKLQENGWQNGKNGSGVVVEDNDDDTDPDALAKAMASLLNRTPEEIEQARERIFAASRPPRPLPEGKTLEDVLRGQWPGDETDEQVFEALRKLS
ncbi:MAG: hypothetical protein SF097_27635 [Acidobacteriota bacterium]|nr:hypothetical protein [Acidobacteriota bacterium]